MIIQSSQINRESAHYLNVSHEETVYRKETEIQGNQDTLRVSLTNEARVMAERTGSAAGAVEIASSDMEAAEIAAPAAGDKTKLNILLKTMEKMTGKKYRFSEIGFTLYKGAESDVQGPRRMTGDTSRTRPESDTAPPENRMRRIETYTESTHSEQESTTVDMAGVVQTADGREIDLDVSLHMSREYYEENAEYSLTVAPLTDPLVVNYDGNAADLTETKYEFDLSADGIDEQISFVTPGTGGFLALDRNRDGIVNDGSELFGAVSGNGFTELAGYDNDQNGWIDAGDAVYYDLSVWEKNNDGEDRLIALADTGIGAIYLNATDSPFRITDDGNGTLGQVRATSVYLLENGGAGTIQQIDLAT